MDPDFIKTHSFHNEFKEIPFHSIVGFVEVQGDGHTEIFPLPVNFQLVKSFMG